MFKVCVGGGGGGGGLYPGPDTRETQTILTEMVGLGLGKTS